jgi:hypothetical protein
MLNIKNFIALLIIIGLGFSVIQAQKRRPSRFLIPGGYVGWIRIDYKVDNASPLPIEDGHYLIKIPSSGLLKTSSVFEGGVATDEYFSYSYDLRKELVYFGDDSLQMIWDNYPYHKNTGVMGSDAREVVFTSYYLFAGTKEDFQCREYEKKDENYYPRVGNVERKKENKDCTR